MGAEFEAIPRAVTIIGIGGRPQDNAETVLVVGD
jgi:hypothetical protein